LWLPIAAICRHSTTCRRPIKIGDVLVAQGNLGDAMEAYRDSLAIRTSLTADHPDNNQWRRDLGLSYNKIGDVLVAQGRLDEALAAYRDDLAIIEPLATSDRTNTVWQRDLSISTTGSARCLRRRAGSTRRLRHTVPALPFASASPSDRTNTEWQRDLALSHELVGNVPRRTAAWEALATDSLAIRERLATIDRSNTRWERALSVSYGKVGDVLMAQGKLDEALRPIATTSPLPSGLPPLIATIRSGSMICRCLTTESATCWSPRLCSTRRSRLP
jgi:tetratricopeptide (TPR) repeat protein